jgi:hypothetical protein
MNPSNASSEVLKSHFEKMKQILPEVYGRGPAKAPVVEERLLDLLKKSLSVIEAVYLQDQDLFSTAKLEQYHQIIQELKALGFDYQGNQQLMEKAAAAVILQSKLPMEKAKGKRKSTSDSSRKAM